MSYILLTYGLSMTWLLLAFIKYKQSEYVKSSHINTEKRSIISSLLLKPLFFTFVAWGLNTNDTALGFWLVGVGHLLLVLYYLSHFYLLSKKQTLALSEQA